MRSFAALLVLVFVQAVAASSVLYPSSKVRHLEPLTDFVLEHDETHLAEPPVRITNGHIQPYPDHVTVSFKAHGKDFSYDMKLAKNIFKPDSIIEVHGEDDKVIERIPHTMASYHHFNKEEGEFASATLLSSGHVHAVVISDGEMYHVDPITVHEDDMQPHHAEALRAAAPSGMVVAKDSDFVDQNIRCGEAHPTDETEEEFLGGSELVSAAGSKMNVTTYSHSDASRRLLVVERWTDCFDNDDIKRLLSVGVGVDVGYYKKMGSSVTSVQENVAATFADMNLVYVTQMNVKLQLSDTIIKTALGGESWNQDRGGCSDINSKLDVFSQWRRTASPQGLWQLYTDCYGPSGTVGLAWIGTLCSPSNGAGVNSYTGSRFWTVVAHEIGHNFGAGHSFEEGQGQTGGIMDYGDGKLNGEYQFNTKYRKDQMCNTIKNSQARPGVGPTCWTFEPSDVTYKWEPQGFSACSVDCGGGVRTQALQCENDLQPGTPTAFANCQNLPRPPTTQDCNSQACPVEWNLGAYSSCSKPCGDGLRSRSVRCERTQNGATSFVSDSVCVDAIMGEKPTTDELCNTQDCTSFEWYTSPFGDCSKRCNGGERSREVRCRDSGNSNVAENLCTSLKPNATETCNEGPCLNYRWVTTDWTLCDKECGTGRRERTVTCDDGNGNVVADEFCSNSKPLVIENCNTQLCPFYRWKSGQFSRCTEDCGGGTHDRTVECHDFSTVPTTKVQDEMTWDTLCGAGKPELTGPCNEHACPAYEWLISQFGECSKVCGTGTQTRSVKCVLQGSESQVPDSLCNMDDAMGNPIPKPITQQNCATASCREKQWFSGEFQECSRACGGGLQIRKVACVDPQGNELTEQDCLNFSPAGAKPVEELSCNTAACGGRWSVGEWSTCSKQCESGQKTRQVRCLRVGTNIDTTGCPGTAPSTTGTCNAFACPSWSTGPWGECDAGCGEGIRSRDLMCQDYKGRQLPLRECEGSGNVPLTEEICQAQPCPHWHRDPWSECTKICGGGSQTRGLKCRLPHDGEFEGALAPNDDLCPIEKPLTTQPCNADACPEYYYRTTWSACSATCGTGTQTSTVTCVNSNGNAAADELCVDDAPPAERTCNTQECPRYEWHYAGENDPDEVNRGYGECNAFCGGGRQSRQLVCNDMSTIYQFQVDRSFCERGATNPKPQESRSCNSDFNICGVHGKCKVGVCICDAGYFGDNCASPPTVSNVQVAVPSQGAPQGQTIRITWTATGNITALHIALDRTSWRFPQYIGAVVPNNGVFDWTVGPTVEPGNDYKVTVFFTEEFQASSANTFTIVDPCLYKDCGQHGVCELSSKGEPECDCLGGWAGPTCRQSPCSQLLCNTVNSTCDNDALVPMCMCQNGWVGPGCNAPPGCNVSTPENPTNLPACRNGGAYSVITRGQGGSDELLPGCGVCECPNFYNGDLCQNCGLQCKNGGGGNSDCSSCNCPNGWTDSRCGCRHITITMVVEEGDDQGRDIATWIKDPRAVARYGRTFVGDLAGAIDLDPARLILRSITRSGTQAVVSVWLTEQCAEISNYDTYGIQGTVVVPPRRRLLQDSTPEFRQFSLTSVELNFDDAAVECNNNKGHLASILTEEENTRVAALVPAGEKVWIGLLDTQSQNTRYVWLDSKPFSLNNQNSYQNWADGQPSDASQKYVTMNSNGEWSDEVDAQLKSVCVESDNVEGDLFREPTLEEYAAMILAQYNDPNSQLRRGLLLSSARSLSVDNPHVSESKSMAGLAVGLTFLFLFLGAVGGFVYWKKVHKQENLLPEGGVAGVWAGCKSKLSGCKGGDSASANNGIQL